MSFHNTPLNSVNSVQAEAARTHARRQLRDAGIPLTAANVAAAHKHANAKEAKRQAMRQQRQTTDQQPHATTSTTTPQMRRRGKHSARQRSGEANQRHPRPAGQKPQEEAATNDPLQVVQQTLGGTRRTP